MELQEQNKIRELQEDILPARMQEIEDICDRAIPYEIDWNSFAGDPQGLDHLDSLSCRRLNMALRDICIDDQARAAVRDGLRLIRLANAPDKAAMHIRFDDGVLDMRCAYRLHTEGMHDARTIQWVLIEKL